MSSGINARANDRSFQHGSPVESIVFSSDGKTVVSAALDPVLKEWDVSTQRLRRTFAGHTDEVWSLAINHDGTMLASSSADKTVRIWDFWSGSASVVIKDLKEPATNVRFNPTGTIVATASLGDASEATNRSFTSSKDTPSSTDSSTRKTPPELTSENTTFDNNSSLLWGRRGEQNACNGIS